MNRRGFLKRIAATVLTTVAVVYCPSFKTLELEDEQLRKELIIAKALETDDGRMALAAAMVEPIRRRIDYEAIGRNLLIVD